MDFEGLEKPDESDCCNSGCSPCILDLYEERKKKSLESPSNLRNYQNCVHELSYSIFKLIAIVSDSLSCDLYTFEFCRYLRGGETANLRLNVKPGQHLLLKNDLKQYTRAYTPIPNETNNPLQFTIAVKLYENGLMSNYFNSLKMGAETLWRGPYGNFQVNYTFSNIILIAQGVGIAPLFAIAKEMLENEDCNVIFHLFYACRSIEEIALREQLHDLCRFWNFKYEIFLSAGTQNASLMKYNEVVHNDKLSGEYVQEFLKLIDHNNVRVQILICGREAFMGCYKDSVIVNCGINKEHVVLFYI